jgi:molecular chaperone GrpE
MEENKEKKLKQDLEELEEIKAGEGIEIEEGDKILDEEIEIEEEPEDKLQILEREKAEFKDKWLRSVAEFENFRRRSTIEKVNWIKNANQRLILELCDVSDNFERALGAGEKAGEIKDFYKGIAMIHQQLLNILKREGVEKISTDGKEFDPEFHDALAHIPSHLKENKIAATIQNGYLMNGKVIRAARVAVSNGEKPEETGKSAKETKKKKK